MALTQHEPQGAPFVEERESVAREEQSRRAARWLKRHAIPHTGHRCWLATAHTDYRRFTGPGTARGAAHEDVARATMTRGALQHAGQTRKARRERASRRGVAGLLAHIRPAA